MGADVSTLQDEVVVIQQDILTLKGQMASTGIPGQGLVASGL